MQKDFLGPGWWGGGGGGNTPEKKKLYHFPLRLIAETMFSHQKFEWVLFPGVKHSRNQ